MLCILFILFFSLASTAQNRNIDSLLTLLTTDKPDTNKVKHLNKLSWEYLNIGEYNSGLKYGNKALALSRSILIGNKRGWSKGIAFAYNTIGSIYTEQGNYPQALKNSFIALKIFEESKYNRGVADVYNNIGNIYENQGNYSEAIKNHLTSLKIREKIKHKKGVADSYNNIGLIYWNQGNYPDALKNYFASLKMREEIKDNKGIAMSFNNIGLVHYSQNNFPEALKNHCASLKICKDIKDKKGIARSYNNIGIIYESQANYSEALKSHFASLKINEDIKDKQGIAMSYNNIGFIYQSLGNYSMALKNHLLALKLREEIGDQQGIAQSFNNLGIVQTKLNKPKEAHSYLNMALQLGIEIGSKEIVKESYYGLTKLDSIKGNWKEAYQHHKLFIIYRDSIDNEETKKKSFEAAMTYDFQTKEAATKAEQDKKDVITTTDKKRQQLILILVTCVLVLVFVFTGLILSSLRITRKQKITIEEKNKDIIDSINYAKRIQNALLKEEEHVSKHLPAHFVLFKPKDIVSGDFHWSLEKSGHWYVAAVDCTGHGVPGAFMSMLGVAFLNEITATTRILSPAEILDQLRNKIVTELGQSEKDGGSKDGMDISLMRLNLETKEMQWAGANNPLWITSENSKLIEFKPNKQPIGYHLAMEPFINHSIKLYNGDTVYLFTDGYADQFGGQKEKKFMYKKLKELLVSIHEKPMPEQKGILITSFESWKGKLEQVDDVTIIGIRI